MKLLVNGKEMDLACKTAFEVRQEIGLKSDIVILNGFQIAQDEYLSENDNLSIISKGVMPKEEELERVYRYALYVS